MATTNEDQHPKTGDEMKGITEQLYKQNLELAITNKTLSLLRELYQISILPLEPAQLAKKVSDLILNTLDLELVAIYEYGDDSLSPLGTTLSEKLTSNIKEANGETIVSSTVTKISEQGNFASLLKGEPVIVKGLPRFFGEMVEVNYLKIEELNPIRSSLIYPLIVENKTIGALFISLNRIYEDLSQFEKDSIASIVNVIALALDRATLDQRLKVANEKLKDLDRQKTEFVSIASHQLRSPLTAIKGYSSMLLEGSFGDLAEKTRGAVDVIFQSSERLVNIIEDFLNITRIELGKMKYELNEFNLAELAEKMTKEYQPNAERKKLALTFTKDALEHLVFGDSGKISQVISNMIDNSIKYTPTGSIKVEAVKIESKIQIKVIDTGVGLKEDQIEKLFQKFVRADDAGKVNITGTGLGMYVAKQIIEAHQGKIWAESKGKGLGSTFILELPDTQSVDRNKIGK